MRLMVLGYSILLFGAELAVAQLTGRVLDHNGVPVPNAKVRAVRFGAGPGAAAAAGADGAFSLAGLAAGDYQLCADAPGKELLNPCLWETRPAPLKVGSATARVAGLTVQLKQGAPLSVRVDDPALKFSAAEKAGKAHLLIGVWSGTGVFFPARITSEDASGRTYSLTVPVATVAKLTVSSSSVQLRDQGGKPVAPAPVVLDIPAAQAFTGRSLRYAVAP